MKNMLFPLRKNKIPLLVMTAIFCLVKPAISFAQTAFNYPSQYGKPFKGVPDRADVMMYQVNTRSFSKDGNFKGVTARLDSIKALGINVIYLMPIYQVGVLKGSNSPYATQNYDEVGREFGTLQDLRELVDGAHQLKMAVLLDVVANHTSWDHPWITNKDWYAQDSVGNIKYPRDWKDVAQLNFKNNDMRMSLIHSIKSWVYKANVDGFRCDFVDGPPMDFWQQLNDTLHTIKSHKLLMLAEGESPKYFKAGFDYTFGFRYFGNLKSIYSKHRSVKTIDSMNVKEYSGASEGQAVVRYVTNHDVNSSDGTPLELFGGKKGSMAAFVVIAYMKGIPMVYNGQEIATPFRLTFPFTRNKIDWSLAQTNQDVTSEYKKVIAFRNKSKAIRRGTLNAYSSDDVCVFTKQSGKEQVLVLSNLRNQSVNYAVPDGLSTSGWKDAFTGKAVTVDREVKMEPFQYIVLTK
ncbi:alpha-amylase family glycosyl hydrolase [Pedobacter duraquae]|uniref:Glycosidase n=1 Tax=Pedobacter duraquae TaxID=425511 RepID=A0A4R6ILD4_9SPHI|nr:alpha-amylase family glycosyl hydrolase [Pedobacter duraquae]TDO22940.1 glycosidase [Pedobacter duraquae]